MEAAKLARGVRLLQAFADHLDELLEVERLEDGVADGVGWDLVDAALAGGGEDDDVRAALREHVLDALDELVAVHPRHHEIEEDEIVAAVRTELVETDLAILGQLDVELHPLQDCLQQDANGEVIV